MPGLGKTLIINPGSSSIKFGLYDNKPLIDGVVDFLENNAKITILQNCEELDFSFKEKMNIIKSCEFIIKVTEKYFMGRIDKVVYRIVHGGNLKSPSIINSNLLREIKKLGELAPLHNTSLEIADYFMRKVKGKHIACFDTSFHNTMIEAAKNYAIPLSVSKKYGIKRYGFHGIAHQFLFKEAERVSGKRPGKVITCQIGNGVSICAIKNGKSIDTTMGFTPLEGLMMGTRSGDIDPAIIPFLNEKRMSIKDLKNMLEKESGLKGISGFADVRTLLKRKDKLSNLALDMFSYRIKKAIGSYISALGGVELIVLGGGASRSPEIRRKILNGLQELGISLDNDKIGKDSPVKISSGKVSVWAIETNEQKQMFEMTKNF